MHSHRKKGLCAPRRLILESGCSVAGVESVLAALHQHGEYDSEHLNAVVNAQLAHLTNTKSARKVGLYSDTYCEFTGPYIYFV